MLRKWLSPADLKTTAIYADAVGDEAKDIAARCGEKRDKPRYFLYKLRRQEGTMTGYMVELSPENEAVLKAQAEAQGLINA